MNMRSLCTSQSREALNWPFFAVPTYDLKPVCPAGARS